MSRLPSLVWPANSREFRIWKYIGAYFVMESKPLGSILAGVSRNSMPCSPRLTPIRGSRPGVGVPRAIGLSFDAQFFGIAPREAELLDPQQRLLLETAWHAIENAGLRPEDLAGSQTGVYVGVWNTDFETCTRQLYPDAPFYSTTGGGRYAASGRIAYFLDLRGPNLTLDTGCSSSLVAVHLACQSLWSGESQMALVGAANAILSPEITLAYSGAGMLSPEGRCKFGDASADGYVRSEGAAAVVLKPLARALVDGDPIWALIRGSAVNSCGRSSGFLVTPSQPAQEEVFRTALERAGVRPEAIDYVEAHGTGTRAGDPVEIGAIGTVLARSGRTQRCLIGSAKTNIGHTESVAGLAGLIKVALAMKHRLVPASLHFREPNPEIPWQELPVEVATRTVPWPSGAHAPLAAVNSLGITGTNAQVILEAAPEMETASPAPSRPELITMSAQSAPALRNLAERWQHALTGGNLADHAVSDISYTAALRRPHHEFRLALVASGTSKPRSSCRSGSKRRVSGSPQWLPQHRSTKARICLSRTGRPMGRNGERAVAR